MYSTDSLMTMVWKHTKYKLEEYHFFTGKLFVMILLGMAISFSSYGYVEKEFIYQSYTTKNYSLGFMILILWLIYISLSITSKNFRSYDISLVGSYKVSYLSSYLYLIIISFFSIILLFLSKYPLILIHFFLNNYDWVIIDSGFSTFITFVGYGLAYFVFIVTASYMCGMGGIKTFIILIGSFVIIYSTENMKLAIMKFMEQGLLQFWFVTLIACCFMSFIGYAFYSRRSIN